MPYLIDHHRRCWRAAHESLQGALPRLWDSIRPDLPPGAVSELPRLHVDRVHQCPLYVVGEPVGPLLCGRRAVCRETSCLPGRWRPHCVPSGEEVAQPGWQIVSDSRDEGEPSNDDEGGYKIRGVGKSVDKDAKSGKGEKWFVGCYGCRGDHRWTACHAVGPIG